MKARFNTRSAVALVSAVAFAAVGALAAPANAATRDTAIVVESNTFTSFNGSTRTTTLLSTKMFHTSRIHHSGTTTTSSTSSLTQYLVHTRLQRTLLAISK